MIRYLTGDLLASDADALVNPVNTVGTMGKGLALQFARRFPSLVPTYRAALRTGALTHGQVYLTYPVEGNVAVVLFPTKRDWRHPSRLEDIDAGLLALRHLMLVTGTRSIAVPKLGSGLGGLLWRDVVRLIDLHLGDLDADVQVYGTPL
jgi:O-acetyl-ADP-ribose deacetylase (regulator of RNase III)